MTGAPAAGRYPEAGQRYHRRAIVGAVAAASLFAGVAKPSRGAGRLANANAELTAMLGRVPDPLALADPPSRFGAFADIARQAAANGVGLPPAIDEREWELLALGGLALPAPFSADLAQAEADWWANRFGFPLTATTETYDQFAGEGGPATLLRGEFPPTAVRTAWERTGGALSEQAGVISVTFPSYDRTAARDVRGPAYSAWIRHAAILPDETVVFAATEAPIRAIAAAARERTATFAGQPAAAALLAALPALASAIFQRGGERAPLVLTGMSPGAVLTGGAARDAATPTAGAAPAPRAVFALALAAGVGATEIMARLEANLATGTMRLRGGPQPLTEVFPDWTLHETAGSPAVVWLDASLAPDLIARNPWFWLTPYYPGDLLTGVA